MNKIIWLILALIVPSLGMAQGKKLKPHLKATATAGTVPVQWTDTSAGPGVGYFVYKGTTSGGESGTPLNSSPVELFL